LGFLGCYIHAPRGPFYSLKAARSRWKQYRKAILAFCRVAHRTPTVHCPVQIAFLNWRSRLLKIWSRWRTGHCPVHTGQFGAPIVGAPTRHARIARPTVGSPDSPVIFSRTLLTVSRERRLRRRRRTGQSGAPPDSPVIYSRTPPSRPESRLFIGTSPGTPDTVRCTTGQSGAPRPSSLLAVHSQLFSKTISPVSST
jgi:hypothetical protein